MSSQQPAPTKVSSEEVMQNAAPAAAIRVFPVLLIMVAVFPVALGIGVTLQTAPAPVTRIAAAEHVAAPIPNHIQPNPSRESIAMDRSKADEFLRAGRYDVALRLYRSLGNADSLRTAPELALRIGMCEEGLGRWDDALRTYRAVASGHHRTLATAGVLGQSRIWMRLNDYSKAEPLLRALLLNAGDDPSIPAAKLADIAIPYSIVISEQTLGTATLPTCAGLGLVANSIDWSLADALQWIDSLSPGSQIPNIEDVAGPVSASQDTDGNEGIAAESPEGRLLKPVSRFVARQNLLKALEELVETYEFKLDWSDGVKDRAMSQELGFSAQGVPLNLLVTAACCELGARWELQSGKRTIVISEADAEPQSIETCRGLVVGTIAAFPGSRLVSAAKFSLAQLAAADHQVEKSARQFTALTRFSTSPLAIRAAFNAAVIYRRQNDLARTCKSLEVVVHGAPGNELHTRALILYGQTLIDRGEFHEAAFQLKRAANSRHVSDEQARATVFLAMAQILDGKPAQAAESLFSHRFQFQQQSVRDAAALMTSIARWRTADDSAKLREAAFLYRSIVAVEVDSEWLGAAGQLLLGQAMRDADLEDRMAELFLDSLQCSIPQVIQGQMQLAMADYWYGRRRISEAKEIWSDIYAKGGADSVAAGIRMGEVALEEHHPDVCIDICRTLQHRDDAPRTELLKLSGRAHEMAGRPILAAQCYSGQWPLP